MDKTLPNLHNQVVWCARLLQLLAPFLSSTLKRGTVGEGVCIICIITDNKQKIA